MNDTYDLLIMHRMDETKASAIAAWPQSYTTYSEFCVTLTYCVGLVRKHCQLSLPITPKARTRSLVLAFDWITSQSAARGGARRQPIRSVNEKKILILLYCSVCDGIVFTDKNGCWNWIKYIYSKHN